MFYADLAPRCFKKRKNFTPFNIEKIQTISSGEKKIKAVLWPLLCRSLPHWLFCWLKDLSRLAELSQEPEHWRGMGTGKRRSGQTGSLKSYLESINALPLVFLEAKSVRKRSREGLKSKNFSVPYGEKSWKSLIFLLSLLCLILSSQTLYCSSLFLHYWRQRRKAGHTRKCGLVRFIRGFLYFTRSSGWAHAGLCQLRSSHS